MLDDVHFDSHKMENDSHRLCAACDQTHAHWHAIDQLDAEYIHRRPDDYEGGTVPTSFNDKTSKIFIYIRYTGSRLLASYILCSHFRLLVARRALIVPSRSYIHSCHVLMTIHSHSQQHGTLVHTNSYVNQLYSFILSYCFVRLFVFPLLLLLLHFHLATLLDLIGLPAARYLMPYL